jgi:hypothetical protein
MKRLWIVLLLVSFSFSITHAFVFTHDNESHCNINEYIEEITSTIEHHGNVCDFHAQFHQTFVIPHNIVFINNIDTFNININHNTSIPKQEQSSLFRPPIFS